MDSNFFNTILSISAILISLVGLYFSFIAAKAQVNSLNLQKNENEEAFSDSLKMTFFANIFLDLGVILDFKIKEPFSYYKLTNKIVPKNFSLQVSVQNRNKYKPILIAPFLVIEILQVIKCENEVNYFNRLFEGGGGGGEFNNFYIHLSGKSKLLNLVPLTQNENEKPIEYFEIIDSESVHSVLYVDCEAGHIFKFRVGFAFLENSLQKIEWIAKEFLVGCPLKAIQWKLQGSSFLITDFDNEHEKMFELCAENECVGFQNDTAELDSVEELTVPKKIQQRFGVVETSNKVLPEINEEWNRRLYPKK